MEQNITSMLIARALSDINFVNVDFDFSDIDKDLLMIATIKSVSGDVFMLRDIFNEFIK